MLKKHIKCFCYVYGSNVDAHSRIFKIKFTTWRLRHNKSYIRLQHLMFILFGMSAHGKYSRFFSIIWFWMYWMNLTDWKNRIRAIRRVKSVKWTIQWIISPQQMIHQWNGRLFRFLLIILFKIFYNSLLLLFK